jgi:hypothetical protein
MPYFIISQGQTVLPIKKRVLVLNVLMANKYSKSTLAFSLFLNTFWLEKLATVYHTFGVTFKYVMVIQFSTHF